MTNDQNELLVHRYYIEALTPGNWQVLETIMVADFVDHETLLHIPPTRAGLQQKYDLLRTGFPDLCFVVEDLYFLVWGRRNCWLQ